MGLDCHSFGAAYWCQIASFLVPDFIFWVFIGIQEPVQTRRNPSRPQIAHHFSKAWPQIGVCETRRRSGVRGTRRNPSEFVGTRRGPRLCTSFGGTGPRSGVRATLGTRRNPSEPALAPLQPRNKHSRGVLSSFVKRVGC